MEQNSWTLNDHARASSPGHVTLDPLVWLRSYPSKPVILIASLVGAAIMAGLVSYWWIVAVIALLVANVYYWARVKEHFRHGCANPAIVVSTKPLLYAALTDLTRGVGSYPVVKIVRKRFRPALLPTIELGAKVMTVALYTVGDLDAALPHWIGFDPKPVDCATRDAKQIERLVSGVDDEEWAALEEAVGQVPQPFKPGLYPVSGPGSCWDQDGDASCLEGYAKLPGLSFLDCGGVLAVIGATVGAVWVGYQFGEVLGAIAGGVVPLAVAFVGFAALPSEDNSVEPGGVLGLAIGLTGLWAGAVGGYLVGGAWVSLGSALGCGVLSVLIASTLTAPDSDEEGFGLSGVLVVGAPLVGAIGGGLVGYDQWQVPGAIGGVILGLLLGLMLVGFILPDDGDEQE